MFLKARVLLPEMETLVKNIIAVEHQMQIFNDWLVLFLVPLVLVHELMFFKSYK